LRERIGAFPIGVLDGGELEVQFMHFASENEAAEKWSRRLGRTHFDRLFFKFSANSDPTFDIEYLRRFDALDIRKIALSKTSYPEFPSVVTIPEYIVDGKAMYPISLRHFDIVNWLDQP
jgi:uncharacterized protein (DUF1919 family)